MNQPNRLECGEAKARALWKSKIRTMGDPVCDEDEFASRTLEKLWRYPHISISKAMLWARVSLLRRARGKKGQIIDRFVDVDTLGF